METTAKLRHLRQSPRKVRLVADLIRTLPVERALEQLKFSTKKAAQPITKLLNSAIANAIHNHKMSKDNLFIKEIRVDEGATLKRWRARAMGRAGAIRKRTSHIIITLAEIKASKIKTTDKKDDSKSKKEVKIVKSLADIKKVDKDGNKEEKNKYNQTQVEKTKGPVSTKRKLFSRKSG